MIDFIFIAGAPGSGKSTLAKTLHDKLGSPCFEFGWIPEFRQKGEVAISQADEEALSFENLCLVVKNYQRHGFRNVIVTDLDDVRLRDVPRAFGGYAYIIITLSTEDEETLKSRVLDESRSGGYRDAERSRRQNELIRSRELLPAEFRIDVTSLSREEVAERAMQLLQTSREELAATLVRPPPPAERFDSFL